MADGHPLAGRGNDRRIEELDAIRGLMALLVVFYHYSAGLHIIMPDAPTTSWSFAWGEYGVQGFFAVSGFVIFMTLDKTQRASDFAVSRFSRLFPAYWAAMLVTTAVVWLAGPSILHRSAGEFAVNVTMLQSFFGVSNVDESYWTLGLELAFYVLMLLAWRLKLLPHLETIAWLWFALRIGAPLVPALDGALVSVKGLYQIPFFVLGLLAWRVWQRERSFAQLLPLIIAGGLTLWVANVLVATAVTDNAAYACDIATRAAARLANVVVIYLIRQEVPGHTTRVVEHKHEIWRDVVARSSA